MIISIFTRTLQNHITMAPGRRKYRDKLITQAFFAQGPSTNNPIKCPVHGCCDDTDHEHGSQVVKRKPSRKPADLATGISAADPIVSMALGAFVEKWEDPKVGNEISEDDLGRSRLEELRKKMTNSGETWDGFKTSKFTEEIDVDGLDHGTGSEGDQLVSTGLKREVELGMDFALYTGVVGADDATAARVKKPRRRRRKTKSEQRTNSSLFEEGILNREAAKESGVTDDQEFVDIGYVHSW